MDLKLLVDGARDYQPVAVRISEQPFLHPTAFYSGHCYDPSSRNMSFSPSHITMQPCRLFRIICNWHVA